MFKITKESLIDYHVTENGKPFGWITKQKDGSYTVTINGVGEYKGFRYLKDAKEFVISN